MNISENKTSASISICFTELLSITFIVLKLCNIINWSWWWVLSPLWVPIALVLAIFLVVFIVTVITGDEK